MRFTKFLAVTMAAMAITSCSQQEVIEGSTIEPGDAQVVLDLGRSFTTYASGATENAILGGSAKLYDADGNSITWKTGGTIDNTGKLTGVVDAAVVSALTNKQVKLLVSANHTDKSVTPGTTGTDMAKELASTSNFNIYTNQNLATGILSSGQFDLTLVTGPVTAPNTPVLNRTISRIYVKKATGVTAPIIGYNIQIDGLSQSVGVYNYVGTGATAGNITYSVKEAAENGSYDNMEVVGYAYPSTAATVTISYGTSEAQLSNVKFEANKNYALVVNPTVVDGAVVDITFTIDSWGSGGDLDLTMAEKVKITNPGLAGVTLVDDNFTFPTTGLGTASVYAVMTNLLGDAKYILDEVVEIAPPTTRSKMDGFHNETTDKAIRWDYDGPNLKIASMPNVTGKDITYHMSAKTTVDGITAARTFSITVPAVVMPTYPAGFTAMFGGIEWMTMNTQSTGNGTDDIALFNKINGQPEANFFDRLRAYSAVSEENHNEVCGSVVKYVNGPGQTFPRPTCPEGFIIPTVKMYRENILGIQSVWPGVSAQMLGKVFAFDSFTAPEAGSLMGCTFNANITAFGNKGSVIIKGNNDEQLLFTWRGNVGSDGTIANTRVGSIITRTTYGTSIGRFLLGVHTDASFFLMEESSTLSNSSSNSHSLRCVKISPETYWDI